MTAFELLLIAVVLVSAITLVAALAQAVSGNFRASLNTLKFLAGGIAVYLSAVCTVSLSSSRTIRHLGDPDCSDDWCVTPAKVHFEGSTVAVEFRVWSRALRVTQREFGLHPYLLDDRGRKYPVAEAEGPVFDTAISPNESFLTVRRYRIEPGASTLDLVMRDGFGPDTFVIGSSQSLFHKRTVYRLKPAPEPV